MKIKYEFADETIEIEVSEDWGAVLIELDRQEYNNDHAETRRHISLETALEDENNSWLTDNSDTELDALQNVDFARLRAAMQLLEPRQQQLIRQVYIYGGAIVRFLKAAEKYSGYDISGIKEQVEDKRLWFKNTYPEFYELEVPQDKPFFQGGVDDE